MRLPRRQQTPEIPVTYGGVDEEDPDYVEPVSASRTIPTEEESDSFLFVGSLRPEVTHRAPVEGEAHTPCCARSPFELSWSDRMTNDPDLVTCQGRR